MKKILFLLIIFAITLNVFADEEAITSDGRKVLLKDDGTWQYFEQMDSLSLSLIDWTVENKLKNTDKNRYSDEAWLTLVLKNEENKLVKGWRVVVEVKNAFGDLLGQLQLTGGQSKIEPLKTTDATFAFENNQFIDREPYDYLTSYDKNTMTINLIEAKPIY